MSCSPTPCTTVQTRLGAWLRWELLYACLAVLAHVLTRRRRVHTSGIQCSTPSVDSWFRR